MPLLTGRAGTLLLSVALCLLAVALFDLAAYRLLPPGIAARFHPYRCPACVPPPAVSGGGVNLHDYYVANEERGFDIAPNRRGMLHYVDGTAYPIWSNSLGCFDTEPRTTDRYVYLAGDSFAWGFTPFRDKFGTLLEDALDTAVLKCGVSHTGQSHQLGKLKDVVAAVGEPPALIVVTYYANDVADDLAYPTSTVVDGWLVDRMFLRKQHGDFVLGSRSASELESRVLDYVSKYTDAPSSPTLLFAEKYSLSFNIFSGLANELRALIEVGLGHLAVWRSGQTKPAPELNIYQHGLWEADGHLNYTRVSPD